MSTKTMTNDITETGNGSAFDIAILGGGNAGITLAAQLAAQTKPPSTVVIEPRSAEQRDCSWGLWALDQQAQQLKQSTKGRWKRWQLIDNHSRIVHSSDQFTYLSLSSADYLRNCAAQLHDPVSLVKASVNGLESAQERTIINTDQGRFKAKTVYDSRPPKLIEKGLRQHFLGLHIRTQQPLKEPDIATLMDFRVDQSRGLHFIYALPFSEHQLLVESTLISTSVEQRDWYRNAIEGWLSDNNIEVAEIISEEMGDIPMDTLVSDPATTATQEQPLVAPIGAASGAVRRSSGYAFQHIQQQARQLAGGIEQGKMDVPTPISSQLTAMDKIFNGVLLSRPDLSVSLYMRMARTLNGDQFARFMLGRATASDWLRVIVSMPKVVFLKQLLRQLSNA